MAKSKAFNNKENKEENGQQKDAVNQEKTKKGNVNQQKTSNNQNNNPKVTKGKSKKAISRAQLYKAMKSQKTKKGTPNDYPNLLPPAAPGYNLNKRVLAEIYLKELSHSIYHLWLDGLYEPDISVGSIQQALVPLFGKLNKNDVPGRYIYIVASRASDEEPPRPSGSCFIMLANSLIESRLGDQRKFQQQILDKKIHMFRIDLPMLRVHIQRDQVLLFSQAYLDLFNQVPYKFIERIYGKISSCPVVVKTTVKQPATTHPVQQNQGLPTSSIQQLNLNPESVLGVSLDPVIVIDENNGPPLQPSSSQSSSGRSPPRLLIDLDGNQNDKEEKDIVHAIDDTPRPGEDSSIETSSIETKFIPVTSETLSKALTIMEKFEEERRPVAVVFDDNFFNENISLDFIRNRYKSIFGVVRDEQVLIRTNIAKLMDNLDDPEVRNIKTLNQAYIIGERGLNETDINRKAAAEGVFCCPMTMGCVINNLKRGIFLMSSRVLLAQAGHEATINQPKRPPGQNEESKGKNNAVSVKTNAASRISLSNKRNRIAASMDGTRESSVNGLKSQVETTLVNSKPESVKQQISARKRIDPKLWEVLVKSGNTVVKIDNLPSQLTIQALNLIMGTYSLKSDQIVAARSGENLMNVRIAIYNVSEDLKRILSKNKCRTALDSVLDIELTNFKELRQFIHENQDNLLSLDTDNRLPIHKIRSDPSQLKS